VRSTSPRPIRTVLPAVLNLTNGSEVFDVTLNTPGVQAVIASDGTINATGTNQGDEVPVVVVPDVVTAIKINNPFSLLNYGQILKLNISVHAISRSAGMPSGSVELLDAGSQIATAMLDANGNASFSVNLPAGKNALSVMYEGSGVNGTSTSTVDMVLAKQGTQTYLVSNDNPVTIGGPVTFTAIVTSISSGAVMPTENVYFYNGSTFLGSSPLSAGVAKFTNPFLLPGARSISADYQGNATFSTSQASLTEQVNRGPESLTWAPPASINYGTALGASQLDASANVQGTYTYTPAAGAVLNAGTQSLQVHFAPAVPVSYRVINKSVSIVVIPEIPNVNGGPREHHFRHAAGQFAVDRHHYGCRQRPDRNGPRPAQLR
jgi:hypothetical protein